MISLFILSVACIFGPRPLSSLLDKDPKCRYRVHYPEASWHTAYDVCSKDSMTLARASTPIEKHFIDIVLFEALMFFPERVINKSDITEVWIGGFLQTANNRSITPDCQVFDPQLTIKRDGNVSNDVLCLFYHFTEKAVRADDCNARKPFMCETLTYDPEDCLLMTNLSYLENINVYSNNNQSDLCKKLCLLKAICYGFISDGMTTCKSFNYDADLKYSRLESEKNMHIMHKSFFFPHNTNQTPYPVSAPKPFHDWCPEIRLAIIKNRIKSVQKNLTVNKKETSQYVRTLTSAPDKRRSAQNVGFVGVSVIAAVVGVIALSDCVNVINALQNKHRGAKVGCQTVSTS